MSVLVSTHYMDEAERCHEIAYIAYGQLLAQGTIDEVIAQSHLRTYTVSGPDLPSLAEKLTGHSRHRHGGAVRHQPARRRPRCRRARPGHGAVPRFARARTGALSQPSLEDVFISLMARAQDNFQ